jgi:dolichyl-diphosphooligosaccharide--protein glycosyltransferase
MSADPLQALASAGKGKNTLGLLRVIILALIAAAAIASRLFSVIRTWPSLGAGAALVS